MSDVVKKPRAKRGRPRDLGARDAILRAARSLLDEGGPGAVTMEAVASRANVGKPTVYRWWPDRHAVVMAALLGEAQPAAMASAEQRSALDELKEQLLQVVTRFATPTGRHIASMLAAADPGSELARAFRGHFVLARRDEGRAILQRGIERGELREDIDVEAAVDQLLGAVFLRLLLGHAPLDATFVEQLVGNARLGLAARR